MESKKGKYKKIILSFVFLFLLMLTVYVASEILKKKESYYYKDQFFSSDVPYDVLFFGSSHMHEGIDPMYLWEEHGISSYNLASAGESIQMTYYVMKAAFEKTLPKAVVIDSFKIADEENAINEGYAFVHESIDALPFGKTKLEAVDYAAGFFDGGRAAFLSDLYAYHGRYKELEENDFRHVFTYDKGAYIMTEVYKAEAPDMEKYIRDTKEFKGGDGVRYYKKIVELCIENNVTPILVNIPANRSNYDEDSQKTVNTLMEYTKKEGGMAINFYPLLDDIGINYDTDFGDSSHLNFMGAAKTADYLAEYLKLNFGIPDHRSDPVYSAQWEKDSAAWREQKITLLKTKKDAVSYIFLAEDEDRIIRVFMDDPGKTGTMYGFDFCLERTGITPEKTGKDENGGFDMRIEVRRRSDESFLAEQYFNRNEAGRYVTE
ncbi:MAG: DUF1574 domain-containing protein [Lachnospiraceae bacterium]|nr:DUF1574 domain-containing protein [Lachnospiraceae bacterium]